MNPVSNPPNKPEMTEYQKSLATQYDNEMREWTHCLVCYSPTKYTGTNLCGSCWDVESGLRAYLNSPVGRENALNIIKEVEGD